MKRFLLAMFVFLLASSTMFGWGELSQRYWKNALKAEEQGDIDEAVKYFKKVIDSSPDFLNAYFKLGLIEYKRDNIDGAIEWFKKSVDREETTYGFLQLGIFCMNKTKGVSDEAKVTEYYNMAKMYLEKAIAVRNLKQEKEESIKKNQAAAYYNLFIIYYGAKEYDKAEDAALKAIEFPEYQEDMSKQLINIYTQTNRFDKALEVLNEKIAAEPKNITYRKLKIQVMNSMNASKEDLLAEMKELEKLGGDDPTILGWLGQDALNNKDYTKALEVFKRMIDKYPDQAVGFLGYGRALTLSGKTSEGLKYMKQAEEIAEADVNTLVMIADAYMDLKNYPEAINYYARCIVISESQGNPDYSIYHNLANAYMRSEKPNFARAINNYQLALKYKSDFKPSLMGLHYAYMANGQLKEAYNTGQKYLKLKYDKDIDENCKKIKEQGKHQ